MKTLVRKAERRVSSSGEEVGAKVGRPTVRVLLVAVAVGCDVIDHLLTMSKSGRRFFGMDY